MGGSIIAQRGLIAYIWIPAESVQWCTHSFTGRGMIYWTVLGSSKEVSEYKPDILQVATAAQSFSPPFLFHTHSHTYAHAGQGC